MKTPHIIIALLLAITFVSCKKDTLTTDDALRLIPQSAVTIVRLDIPAMMKKADFEAIRNTAMYREEVEKAREENPALARAMENPEESGIDLGKMGYVFFQANPENTRETFNGLLVSLSDSKKLEELAKAEGDVSSKGQFRYVVGDDDRIIAWTKEAALFGNSNDFINLVDKAEKIFQTKPGESVIQDRDLQKAFAENHDLTLWFNSNPISGSPDVNMGISMAELDAEAMKDNYIHGHMDFLDGRIEGTADLFLQPKLTKDLYKLFNDEVGSDFAKYVPADHLAVLVTGALSVRGIDEVLSARSQSRGFLEFTLKEYGITMKDIRETFGGDVVVAAVGQEGSDKHVGLLATNILDDKKLQLFLDIAVEKGSLEKERENQYKLVNARFGGDSTFFTVTMDDGAPRLLVKDGFLFVCGDENWLHKLETGGFDASEQLKGDILKKSGNHVFSLYLDSDGLRSFNKKAGEYSMKDMQMQASKEKVDLLIRMKDGKMNALKALFLEAEREYEREVQ